MRLTAPQTFHPKGQLSITLTVDYGPSLNAIAGTGYLEVGVSSTYVSRVNFRIFNAGDQPLKKALFSSLTPN